MITVGRSLSDWEFRELSNKLAAEVDSGNHRAAHELADTALRELREVDVSDRLGGLFARADSGDREAMALTAELRRRGRIVPHDIPLAVSLYEKLAESEPEYNEKLVDALLCSDDPADWKRAFDVCSKDGGKWTWDYLARMHHEGIGTPKDIYEAARIIEEHDLFPDRVKCALRIRPELHGRRNLVLAGTPDEVDVLFVRCMEDNVRPDFWWCPDNGTPRCVSVLEGVVTGINDPSAVPDAVLLCETPVDAPDLPVYSVSGGEPLLVPDKGLRPATTCFVYTDEHLDAESERFLRSKVVFNANEGTGGFERFMESDDAGMNIVVAADVETIGLVLSKVPSGKARVCTGHYSRNLVYMPLTSPRCTSLAELCFRYALGGRICDRIGSDSGKRALMSNPCAMGDQFRYLARRESYSDGEPSIIVNLRARDLPELTCLDGYVLSSLEMSGLGTYKSLASDSQDIITMVGLHPIFPG